MTLLHDAILVHCPLSQAPLQIDRFFRDNARQVGEAGARTVRLPLRATLGVPGLRTALSLTRDVAATISQAAREPGEMDQRMVVEWRPADGGPFPRFHGALRIEGDEDYSLFRLVLDGAYEPPLGVAGQLFDAILGRRIAAATATDLLAHMRKFIEQSYRESEAAKQARNPGAGLI
jgi:hypothetical protein